MGVPWFISPLMKRTLLYRLFGIGAVPKKLRPMLEREGVVVLDEGMGGWFIARKVKGPHKRYRGRAEGFSGCLAITGQRVVCYTYGKRQINIAVDDPNISALYVDVPQPQRLSLSFESSIFQTGWSGVIEFRFNTDKAELFRDALLSIGAHHGSAPEAAKP